MRISGACCYSFLSHMQQCSLGRETIHSTVRRVAAGIIAASGSAACCAYELPGGTSKGRLVAQCTIAAACLDIRARHRKYGASRWGGMVAAAVSRGKAPVDAVVGELTEDTALEEAQFRDLLERIDRGLRALPATAQVGRAAW